MKQWILVVKLGLCLSEIFGYSTCIYMYLPSSNGMLCIYMYLPCSNGMIFDDISTTSLLTVLFTFLENIKVLETSHAVIISVHNVI